MPTRLEANPEEIAKVRTVLESSAPRGAMIERIEKETSLPNYIIYSAIRALKKEGIKIVGLDPMRYDDPEDQK